MLDITASTFASTLATTTTPVLVEVWAPWCVPCRTLAPQLDRVAKEYDGVLLVAKLDADTNTDLCKDLGVSSVPTLLVFVGGKEVARKGGAAGGYLAIKQLVAPHLAPPTV